MVRQRYNLQRNLFNRPSTPQFGQPSRVAGSCYLSTNFCLSSVKKKMRFLGFEPETKISLTFVASLHHHPTTSLRRHNYNIPTYLQACCVSCLFGGSGNSHSDAACNFCPDQLGCVWLPRPVRVRSAAPKDRVACGCPGVGQEVQLRYCTQLV